MNKTEHKPLPTTIKPPPRPDRIPFYRGLGQPTLPRYVRLKNNKNKYDGNGNLKTK